MIQTNSRVTNLVLPAKCLRIHPRAQRAILPSKLKKMVASLDLNAIGVIHVVG